ncbi:hypothetical protein J6590_072024 [Homalodisca vitripennis]|nr:hypothetical protein J6590_072024 [Homalodisca vitripennis]
MLIFVSTAVRGDEIPISVVSGVYWKPIPHALVYESTVPLFYRSFWPAVESMYYRKDESRISFCKMLNSPECILFGWIKQADKRIGLQMSWLNTSIGEDAFSLNSISVRNKRSLHFIGRFMDWCCGVATTRDLRPLFANDKQLKEYDFQLQQGLKGAFSEIDSVMGNVSDYGAEMEKMFSKVINVGVNISKVIDRMQMQLSGERDDVKSKIMNLLQLLVQQETRQLQTVQLVTKLEIISQCREKKIPTAVVKPKIFLHDLEELNVRINKQGYQLVVPITDVSEYLKLEIADCVISDDVILVNIKVPIVRLQTDWKLYEMIAAPFAWHNTTCVLQHETTYVAASDKGIASISGSALHDCQVFERPLCFVPRYPGDTLASSLCHRKLFEGATIQDLTNYCVYSCTPGSRPLVSMVDDQRYVITHAQEPLRIQCRTSGVDKYFSTPHAAMPGALEIKVPCDCKLLIGENLLISELYPCINETYVTDMTHIIPASWSKLKSLKLPPLRTHASTNFENFTECLDFDWPTKVPHLNVSFSGNRNERFSDIRIDPSPENQFPSLSAVLNGVVLFLVIAIIVRNPYLLGIGCVRPVIALDENSEESIEPIYVLCLTWCITLFMYVMWRSVVWLWRRRSSRRHVVTKGNKEPGGVGERPLAIPLATLHGKELRITIEETCAAEVTDTFSTGD